MQEAPSSAGLGLYEYANKVCRAKQGAGAGYLNARAREHGRGLGGAGGLTAVSPASTCSSRLMTRTRTAT